MGELVTEIMVMPDGMTPDHPDSRMFSLIVNWRGTPTDTGRGGYGVNQGGFESRQLSRAGNWGWPRPFQQHQYRWRTLEEALEVARRRVNTVKINGRTWSEWRENDAEAVS